MVSRSTQYSKYKGETVDPFKDATYEQLTKILRIINSEQAARSMNFDFMLTWTDGKKLYPNASTDSFIEFWRNVGGVL